jgi:hypothetical protein
VPRCVSRRSRPRRRSRPSWRPKRSTWGSCRPT